MMNVLQHTSVDVAVVPSIVIEQLAVDPNMRQLVSKKIKALGYAGSDISQAAADTLAEDTNLFSSYASTEIGIIPTIRPSLPSSAKNRKRLIPHPESGVEFRQLSNNEYEAIIVRSAVQEDEQPVFKVFPYLQKWSTRDIFTPDPAEPGSWIYHSRVDERIVFLDGTSFNPLQFEQQISGHLGIQAALMFGTRRPQAGLLIESRSPQALSGTSRSEIVELVWPCIAKANNLCTAQSTILKTHVVFASPEKPLPRADNGAVQRVLALQLYESEIDSLYS